MPFLGRHYIACLIRGAKQSRIVLLLEEVAHDMAHRVRRQYGRNPETRTQKRSQSALSSSRSTGKQHNHIDFWLHKEGGYEEIFKTIWLLVVIDLEAVVQDVFQGRYGCCDLFDNVDRLLGLLQVRWIFETTLIWSLSDILAWGWSFLNATIWIDRINESFQARFLMHSLQNLV